MLTVCLKVKVVFEPSCLCKDNFSKKKKHLLLVWLRFAVMKLIGELRTNSLMLYSAFIYIPLVIKLMTLYTDLKKEKTTASSFSDLLEILIPTYQSSPVFELENCLKECFSTSPYSCAPTKWWLCSLHFPCCIYLWAENHRCPFK